MIGTAETGTADKKTSEDSTYVGPTVFNISSNQKKTVTFTETGEVQGPPQQSAPQPKTLQESASKAGLSVEQLSELFKANKAQNSQPSPNASLGNNAMAAGTPSRGTSTSK